MIESTISNLLSTASAITAIAATRIYPVVLPNDPTLPALTYKIISAVSSPTFLTRGSTRWRIQIDCWGESYADAVNLRAAVNSSIDGYYGPNNLVIQSLSSQDFFDEDALQYRAMAEFYCHGV